MNAQHTLPYPQADLRTHPPRGPREQLAGLLFLPRTIDKVRAKLQGTLGLYKVAPGISGYLFEWLGITEEQFTQAILHAPTPRPGRYTILEHLGLTEAEAGKRVGDYVRSITG